MTREEAQRMAYDMGAHPYSISGMTEALLKGCEIGRAEQKATDDAQLPLIKETYYNAGYETAKNKMIDKAWEWITIWAFENAPHEVYDDLMSYACDFKKAMED